MGGGLYKTGSKKEKSRRGFGAAFAVASFLFDNVFWRLPLFANSWSATAVLIITTSRRIYLYIYIYEVYIVLIRSYRPAFVTDQFRQRLDPSCSRFIPSLSLFPPTTPCPAGPFHVSLFLSRVVSSQNPRWISWKVQHRPHCSRRQRLNIYIYIYVYIYIYTKHHQEPSSLGWY